MTPRQPRQARAVEAEPRGRIEIATRANHFTGSRRTGERQADEGRHGLASRHRVVLADADEPLARLVYRPSGVDPVAWRCERLRRATRSQPIQALVGELGIIDAAAADGVGGSAVLVD